MSKPYKCPVCNGTGRVMNHSGGTSACETNTVTCPACKGACIVWKPEGAQASKLFTEEEKEFWGWLHENQEKFLKFWPADKKELLIQLDRKIRG